MLLAFFFFNTVVQATLVLPVERTTGLGCIPEGRTVSYECTVDDDGSRGTVWRGSAFNCSSPLSVITLNHFRYDSGGDSETCGDLSAMSVGVTGNEYTSRLALAATAGLNGTTIECTRSSIVVIGSDILKTGVPPPRAQSAMVAFTSTSSFTVSWTQPFITTNVGGYIFTVTGEDCGCESMNVSVSTTSVSCSGWMVSDQICNFEVRTISEDCGFPSDDPAARTSVFLSVPSSPRSPLSLGNVRLTCSFESTNAVLSWMAPSVMFGYPPIQTYRVMVNNGAEMSTIGTETNITIPGSTFPNAGTYSFSVKAVNVLGDSDPLMADLKVALTNVASSSSTTNTSANLTFLLSNTGCVGSARSASITVYYQDCADQTDCRCPQNASFSTNRRSTSVTSNSITLEYINLSPGFIYCYRSEVVIGNTIVGFENGQMFNTSRPFPPVIVGNAKLVMNGDDPPTYQCVNPGEGFNGGSPQMVVPFDTLSLQYLVPICSLFHSLIAVIVIVVLIVLIVIVIVVVILIICLVKKYKGTADDEKGIKEKTSPPADSLYADPKSIEHEAAPGTEDQYAMVDRKVKKNTKPTPPEALYQDPNTIEHETAASGDTYAVVDKPKRSSKKKGGPDVVPPASEGLTYADIDLSSKRPKPGSGRQAPQQPGEYPKEHPVEYSSVDHGNTSQL